MCGWTTKKSFILLLTLCYDAEVGWIRLQSPSVSHFVIQHQNTRTNGSFFGIYIKKRLLFQHLKHTMLPF